MLSGVLFHRSGLSGLFIIMTGAWYDPDMDSDPDCCKHGNPNTLTADLPTSKLAQGPGAQTCLIDVQRLEEEPPSVTVFDPPAFVER